MSGFRVCAVAMTAMLSWSCAGASVVRAEPAQERAATADIDAFVRRAMAEVAVVPGLSLAVVRGDEALMTAGYGVADVETGVPADARTRFYIASATKAFTALSIAAMARRGEVDLEAPLASWSGETALPADMAAQTSLTDLLSHRSGLDNEPISFRAAYSGDHSWEGMQALLAETVRRPDAPRGTFRYSNVGYNLATTLLEGRFGRDWRELVERETTGPLGMTATTARIEEARLTSVIASGHLADTGAPRVSPLQKEDATMQSAGGLVSTAQDMALWLEVQLNDGVLDGRRVFPEGLVASTHRALAAQDTTFGAYRREGYGLGWQIGRSGDERLIHHFGNFAGSRAHVSFMPERGVGVAVMINEDAVAGELADLVADYVYDRLNGRADLAAAYEEKLTALKARRDRRVEGLARARAERAQRPWTLSQPLSSYAGTYVSPAMGRMLVAAEEGGLRVWIGVLSAKAEAYPDPETIRVELVPLNGQTIRFEAPDRLVFEGRVFVREAAWP
ncbi:serine hydrolase domain-containing protein [Brevundimonas faecalis]|uniref:serine hydrolase domain-containing protein n=1 Tax=Brevundimonas faecalis TaxID=947378 RepID=UPI0036140EE5